MGLHRCSHMHAMCVSCPWKFPQAFGQMPPAPDSSGTSVDAVTAKIKELNINGNGNVVYIGNTKSQESGTSGSGAPSAATAADRTPAPADAGTAPHHAARESGTSAAAAADEASPEAGGRPQRKRWYVICKCNQNPQLVGIWHCCWRELQRRLPGRDLCGSSARPCKAFDDRDQAKREFERLAPELTVIFHEA